MKEAARLYGNVAKQISSPRDLEANLLLEAAAKLQAVRDDWGAKRDNLDVALRYNRRLWSVFLTSVTDNGSPLPSTARCSLDPPLARSTGFAPHRSPPDRPHADRVHADPRPVQLTGLAQLVQQ